MNTEQEFFREAVEANKANNKITNVFALAYYLTFGWITHTEKAHLAVDLLKTAWITS